MFWEDQRLARRISKGDDRAFSELMDKYGSTIQHIAFRYTNTIQDRDDLTQEVFIAVYRSINNFKGRSSLKTWLYRIALNVCLRYAEKSAASTTLSVDDSVIDIPGGILPEIELNKSITSDAVKSAISSLNPIHKAVVILHEMEGLTFAECSEVLDIPVGTVKSRLSNAFKHLRVALKDHENICNE